MSKKIAGAFICAVSLVQAHYALAAETSIFDEPVEKQSEQKTLSVSSATKDSGESPVDLSSNSSDSSTQEKPAAALEESSADSSLEALMNVEVTSVSRKAEAFSDVPAALTVITQEDIRRSGFSSLPEILRLVPGLHVARVGTHRWAISARGFSNEFANKLLVLIDGRTVYNPAYSGVYWESHDLIQEDIERIEVIRGPGAAVWGANAVNGVINIITKSAKDTQGTLITTRVGSQEKIGGLRFGAKLGDKAFGRFYIKKSNYEASLTSDGKDSGDDSRHARAGFRIDWEKSDKDTLTLQGDINNDKLDSFYSRLSLAPPATLSQKGTATHKDMNLLGRWTRILGKDSDMSLQMYFDSSLRRTPQIESKIDQIDLDFNHRIRLNPRHEIVWGLGYRKVRAAFKNSFELSVNSPKNNTNLFSTFVQDDITLREDKLRLILGTKIEHNSFTGLELQPSARMVWTPDDKQTVWAAISRAMRTPAHTELGLRSNIAVIPNPFGPPVLISAFGDASIGSEKLIAHEMGYRVQPNKNFVLDVTAFYNRYRDLVILEARDPYVEFDPMPPHVVAPFYYANNARGSTYGIEISPTWKVTDRWKLTANYSYFKANLSSTSSDNPAEERQYPNHMVQLRSALDLSKNLTFDVFASFTGKHGQEPVVPAYSRLDLRLGWQPSENLDLSMGVQNLTSARHKESQSILDIPREIPRSVYVQGAWKF